MITMTCLLTFCDSCAARAGVIGCSAAPGEVTAADAGDPAASTDCATSSAGTDAATAKEAALLLALLACARGAPPLMLACMHASSVRAASGRPRVWSGTTAGMAPTAVGYQRRTLAALAFGENFLAHNAFITRGCGARACRSGGFPASALSASGIPCRSPGQREDQQDDGRAHLDEGTEHVAREATEAPPGRPAQQICGQQASQRRPHCAGGQRQAAGPRHAGRAARRDRRPAGKHQQRPRPAGPRSRPP